MLVFWETMKTTLDLPDDLMRRIKVKAAQEDRKLKDLVADLLQAGLASTTAPAKVPGHRVQLPLITGGHPAAPGDELTPERVADLLLAMDVEDLR